MIAEMVHRVLEQVGPACGSYDDDWAVGRGIVVLKNSGMVWQFCKTLADMNYRRRHDTGTRVTIHPGSFIKIPMPGV